MKLIDAPLVAVAVLLIGAAPSAATPPSHAATPAPRGMVAFYPGAGCPEGWATATVATGRILVATADVDAVGRVVGTPLGAEEDRVHTHGLTAAAFDLPYKSVSAADGGNASGAAAGARPITGTVAPATTGLPFVQLTTCVSP